MFCGECGKPVDEARKFCTACGAAVSEPVADQASRPVEHPPTSTRIVTSRSVNGLAIASMVLGILWMWWVGSLLALAFGYAAKRQIRESNGQQYGEGMATTGIILGWVAITIGLVMLAIVVVATSSHGGRY